MILERTDKGWGIYYNDNSFKYLNTKQIKEIIYYLKKHKYDNLYLQDEDLIIHLKKECIKVKKYKSIKNRPYISDLNNKINIFLLRKTVSNINNLFNKYNLKLNNVTLSICLLFDSIVIFN